MSPWSHHAFRKDLRIVDIEAALDAGTPYHLPLVSLHPTVWLEFTPKVATRPHNLLIPCTPKILRFFGFTRNTWPHVEPLD